MMRFLSLLLFGMMLAFAGCSHFQRKVQTAPAIPESREYMKPDSAPLVRLAFDPMSLGPSVFAQIDSEAGGSTAGLQESVETSSITGYRVQLGAFIDQSLAYSLAQRARTDLNTETYVVFDRPFYRVRAGDYRELSDAEALKTVAIGKGYQDARIAREEIVITD